MLDDPEPPLRVEDRRLDVAMAEGPDFRAGVGLPGEGIVTGRGAVGTDAENLAHVAVQMLGLRPDDFARAVAGGDVEHAVAPEREARPEVGRAVERRQRAEDHPDVVETRA